MGVTNREKKGLAWQLDIQIGCMMNNIHIGADVLFCYFFVNLLQTLIVLYIKRAKLKTLF